MERDPFGLLNPERKSEDKSEKKKGKLKPSGLPLPVKLDNPEAKGHSEKGELPSRRRPLEELFVVGKKDEDRLIAEGQNDRLKGELSEKPHIFADEPIDKDKDLPVIRLTMPAAKPQMAESDKYREPDVEASNPESVNSMSEAPDEEDSPESDDLVDLPEDEPILLSGANRARSDFRPDRSLGNQAATEEAEKGSEWALPNERPRPPLDIPFVSPEMQKERHTDSLGTLVATLESPSGARRAAETAAQYVNRRRHPLTYFLLGMGAEHLRHRKRERNMRKSFEKQIATQNREMSEVKSEQRAAVSRAVALEHAKEQIDSLSAKANRFERNNGFVGSSAEQEPRLSTEVLADALQSKDRHVTMSAWHRIELDAKTGKALENPELGYGREFHHEQHMERLLTGQQADRTRTEAAKKLRRLGSAATGLGLGGLLDRPVLPAHAGQPHSAQTGNQVVQKVQQTVQNPSFWIAAALAGVVMIVAVIILG